MYAPAKVVSQLSGCEHVNKGALCFKACAFLHQDANTQGPKSVRHEQTKVSIEEVPPIDNI
eukprot:697020-Pelagomonas_calceolata.AAC.2